MLDFHLDCGGSGLAPELAGKNVKALRTITVLGFGSSLYWGNAMCREPCFTWLGIRLRKGRSEWGRGCPCSVPTCTQRSAGSLEGGWGSCCQRLEEATASSARPTWFTGARVPSNTPSPLQPLAGGQKPSIRKYFNDFFERVMKGGLQVTLTILGWKIRTKAAPDMTKAQ